MDQERFVIYVPSLSADNPVHTPLCLAEKISQQNEERANGILNIVAGITSLQLLAPKGPIYTQVVYTRPQLFVPFILST